ncbi:hypothetical protein F2P56_031569 [Juglans regia]|uniref:Retrovirus-related Pol polyprotein from transposon RE1 n=1 Tax=Juglans regia TaxID=51240 RepID=A0A833TSN0_JUGRE|nr:hypothetical protein F2P56_031569 [Juglans regia]
MSQSLPSVTTSPNFNVPSENNIVAINAHVQLLYKLNSSNFHAWRAQLDSLVIGYDLQGFIDDSNPCPILGINLTAESRVARSRWIRQDKLLLNGIFASVSESIMPLIVASGTSREAWLKLTRLYAHRSRTRVIQLKDTHTSLTRGSKSVTEYLQQIKTIADELALVDSLLTNDDLTLYILNGLGYDFRDIADPIRTSETSLKFEELHDLLVSHETYIKRLETLQQNTIATTNYHQKKSSAPSNRSKFNRNGNHSRPNQQSSQPQHSPQSFNKNYVICQFCSITSHTARQCKKFWTPSSPNVNCATTGSSTDKSWIVDSGASHHITSDMSKLSIHSEYDGTDEVIIGDGSRSDVGGDTNARTL